MKNKYILSLFIVSACIFPVNSLAELTLSPSILLREEYNDNIFLDSSNKKDDFITSVNPAMILKYTSNNTLLDLSYSLKYEYYVKNQSLMQKQHSFVTSCL
jgi:uncharacterized protein (PEP-CTERM system associated)